MTHYLNNEGRAKDLEAMNKALFEKLIDEDLDYTERKRIQGQMERNDEMIDGYKHADD